MFSRKTDLQRKVRAQRYVIEKAHLQNKTNAQANHNFLGKKNSKNGAGTTVFSRKADLPKNYADTTAFSRKTDLRNKTAHAQEQIAISRKRILQQKTAQAQQYFLKKLVAKKNGAGTRVFSRKTDLQQQKTSQAQQHFIEKLINGFATTTTTTTKRRTHNNMFSKNGFAKRTAQAQEDFLEKRFCKNKRRRHNNTFPKNRFAKEVRAQRYFSRKADLQKKKNGAGTIVFSRTAALQKTALAQQYYLEKPDLQKQQKAREH